ncbi:MAG: Hpt domain-containing protein [Bdellovibrionales bacterium]|nr:Hpt domain-containing protein [Bdellovibrionales bacterium]
MNFDEMMAELKAEYVASFPEKLTEIRSHYEANDREKLRDDFHKLKGTGKTYGLPEVSILCEVVEKLCLAKGASPNQFVEKALLSLKNIHLSQLEKKSYTIENCADYKALLQLLHKVDNT